MYVKHTPLLSEEHECIVTQCIGCGIAVHRELGPGFKERIYHTAYCLELDRCGLKFESEKRIEVKYRDWFIPGQRIDLVVEGVVLVEIKATPKVRALHKSQVVSYLKTMGLKVGLLMNFNSVLFKDGLHRIVA